jgi:3-hydroxyacyl-CoA dehydrogenase/enoyl-CoA hydratase/3-hydroxybutyryl-CoA epimerase
VVGADAVIASNTSTLPITGWRRQCRIRASSSACISSARWTKCRWWKSSRAPDQDETLARGFDFVLQIKKTPIVVNDSRGFFTSRVFGTFTNEGIAMLGEGVARR